MADPSGMDPALLIDPSSSPQYADMLRKQQIAQMLMSAFQNASNSPSPQIQSNNPYAVQPRRGIMQDIAPILTGALASKANSDALKSQINYFAPKQPFQSAPYDPNAAAQAPSGIAAPAPGPGSPTNQPTTGPQPGGLVPPGMSRQTAAQLIRAMGPAEYAKAFVAKQYEPTDMDRMLDRAGVTDPAERQAAFAAAIKKQNNIPPVDVRAGGTLFDSVTGKPIFSTPQNGVQTTYDPTTGAPSQSLVPGAAAAAGAMTGAETAAKVNNTPMMVPMGSGVEAPRYPGQIPGLGAPPGAQTPGAPPGAAPAIGVTRAPAPASPAAAAPLAAAKPTDLWSTVPKLPIPNTPGQSTDTFHQKLLENAAAKHAELQNTYGQQSDLADQKLQYNAEALKALPNAEVGPLSDWLTTNRQRLLELGMPEGLIPSSGTVTPTLELNKNLLNTALQGARSIYGSRMTQNEVKLQTEEMSPGVSMTRDAIGSLIQQDNIRNGYAKQRASDYQTYVAKGGDPMQFEQWYASKRPLQRFAAQSQTPAAAIQRLQQQPQLLPDFKKKYGWDPSN